MQTRKTGNEKEKGKGERMTDKTVASEILNQLGGNRFIAMTGAKYFSCDDNSLNFAFPGSKLGNKCRITLNVMDTYDMTFYKIRGINVKETAEISGLYNDTIAKVFSEKTGLAISL